MAQSQAGVRCNRGLSAGQTRTTNTGCILPCNHIVCTFCYDSCIAPAGGRILNTTHSGLCPVQPCGSPEKPSLFTQYTARKWTPSDLTEQRICGSVIGESAPTVELTGASEPAVHTNHTNVTSPEPVPEAEAQAEVEDNGVGEEVAGSTQQSASSLFTTASDADHTEQLGLIRDDADDDNETTVALTEVEVESTLDEPGSGNTTPTPGNQTTFSDHTHGAPLTISSQSESSPRSTPSVESGTSSSDSVTVSPSTSSTESSENDEPVPPSPKPVLETRTLKRSMSQMSEASNDPRPAPKSRRLRQESWSSDNHTPPSSQEKDEAYEDLYGDEAKAQALLERGDSEDDAEYSVHSSSQPESLSDEHR